MMKILIIIIKFIIIYMYIHSNKLLFLCEILLILLYFTHLVILHYQRKNVPSEHARTAKTQIRLGGAYFTMASTMAVCLKTIYFLPGSELRASIWVVLQVVSVFMKIIPMNKKLI